MLNPKGLHPGQILLREHIEPQGLSITEAARMLGISRQRLSRLVNCKSGITPEIAIRLELVFGEPDENWCRMQATYDVEQARKKGGIKVKRVDWSNMAFPD